MARIPMTSGFTLIPTGEYVFLIEDVKYDEKFGTLEVKLVTADGMKHTERFSLMENNGDANEKAMNAFSYFAKTALNDFSVTDIDHTDLIGHYIRAEVVHTKLPSKKDPNKTVTFANLGDKAPADGFEGQVSAPAVPVSSAAPSAGSVVSGVDLNALLG